jgi:hypothetical protein
VRAMKTGRRDIDVWWLLGAVFMALAVLFAFGEWRGWWGEFGELATALSLGLAVLSFATAATRRTVRQMDAHLDTRLMSLSDNVRAIRTVLERIEALLQRR